MRLSFFISTVCVILLLSDVAHGRFYGESMTTPRVDYAKPDNDSVVDLTGKKSLVFSWKRVPIPAGGRELYRFTLYKGFGYDVVLTKDIDSSTFSIEIPADEFEDGVTYSWRVKQRDSRSLVWSLYDTWHFKVIKKSG